MELTQVNNSNINNDIYANKQSTLEKIKDINQENSGSVKQTSALEKIKEIQSNAISISITNNEMTKRSSISADINQYISEITNSDSISATLKQQVKTISQIQDKVLQLQNNEVAQEEIQPDVTKFISQYNNTVGSVNEKMDRLEDLKGDSTTYFDGAAGAIPLDIDTLNSESTNIKVELKNTLEKVTKINQAFKEKAMGVITKEIEKLEQESPFKEINFGKESADFNRTQMNAVSGSILSSQANAVVGHNIRLLS